jgi:oligoendopeptidase F
MKKIRTQWNLKLLYQSIKDPKIDNDVQVIERACNSFSKQWSSRTDYTQQSKVLLKALSDYQQVMECVGDAKPVAYYMLARDIDTTNTRLSAKISQIQERITQATNQVLFFEIQLGHIAPSMQQQIRRDTSFAKYLYFLEKIWTLAKHRLTDGQEQVMALKSEPAYQLWIAANNNLVAQQEIVWKKKLIPINQAIAMIASLSPSDRKKLHSSVNEKLKSISFLAAAELNAVCINKKIDDQLRSFVKPYSATICDYENDESVIESMMQLIAEHQKYAHEFFKLKAEVMGVKQLHYCDMNVTLAVKHREISFEQGVAIVMRAFEKVHPQYAEIFKTYLENGQIDVYSRVGKQGGGYCWGGYNQATFILLNWTNDFRSVMTLAHEMGHAIHREYAKAQTVFYEAHPISTAEVASTLFENFVFEELVSELPPNEQRMMRLNRVQDSISTVFRQGAYFGFEQTMHKRIRAEGQISRDDLAHIMAVELKKHLGNHVVVTDDDGYLFVQYSHARWFFYVYSYAYGKLISNVLYKKYLEDRTFIKQINQFLSAGGSQSPEAIFKSIGVDTTQEAFWKEGLEAIGNQVKILNKEFK